MNKARRLVAIGLGTLTPAFVVTDGTQPRSVMAAAIGPTQSGTPTLAPDRKALKSALLQLSPTEKLRIAGDRIRLAKSNIQSNKKAAGPLCFPSTGSTLCNCRIQAPQQQKAPVGGAQRAR
jgi:hypothetical protein